MSSTEEIAAMIVCIPYSLVFFASKSLCLYFSGAFINKMLKGQPVEFIFPLNPADLEEVSSLSELK